MNPQPTVWFTHLLRKPLKARPSGLTPTNGRHTMKPTRLVCTFPIHCRLQCLSQTRSLRSRYGTSQLLMPSRSVLPWKPLPCQHSFEMRHAERSQKTRRSLPRCINMKREAASAPRSRAGGDMFLSSWTGPSASLIYRRLTWRRDTK